MTDLEKALELAENWYDGTDYDFLKLTPDEQNEIVDAARRFANLTSPETIEKGAKALWIWERTSPTGEFIGSPWETVSKDWRTEYVEGAEAVLRAVEEGTG